MIDKFDPIRKGLLEFAVLTVIASKKVYAADILAILNATEFVTQEGTLYPLLSRMRREGTVEYEVGGIGCRTAAKILSPHRQRQRSARRTERILAKTF